MDYIIEIITFLIKLFALVIAVLLLVSGLIALSKKDKEADGEKLKVRLLNDSFSELAHAIEAKIHGKKIFKNALKQEKKLKKLHEKSKESLDSPKKNVYVIDFKGDIRASANHHLSKEITALVKTATSNDEIVCRLESPGGMVHSYGLAASQLARIRAKGIPLTVCIDKVAASGGYLMAAMANTINAAPYAIIGSIGVVAQFPNFNRLLKKHSIDYELLTAGEYKRTLTMMGENTEKGRQKMIEELEDIHQQFKNTIATFRPQLNVDQISTGEHWLADKALTLKLVDNITTSDDYLLTLAETCDIYHIHYQEKKKLTEKFIASSQQVLQNVLHKLQEANHQWWN